MATIFSLPNEVICKILSSNSINIQDFVNFCSTCKQFRDIIEDYSTFWQRKFHQRWPHLMKICEKEMEQGYVIKKDFKELLKTRTKYKKTLQHFLASIRKKNYHVSDELLRERESISCLKFCNVHHYEDIYFDEEDLKLLSQPNETIHILDYYFFIDEIKSLVEHSQNERHDNLTNTYYAEKLLEQLHLNHYYLKNVWQKFINRPAEKQLVEEVIIFLRQWCLPDKDISYLYVETELSNIVQKVMQRLRSKHFMHPILSVSHKQFLFWQYNNIYKNQWNYEDGKQILDTINEIFLEHLRSIKIFLMKATFFEECYHINYYLKRVANARTNIMLLILFQSVARRLGMCCNLIFDDFAKIFHLIWEPECNITNSDNKKCFPMYELIWEEINDCPGEYSFKISKIEECSTIFYNSRIRVDTIKLIEILSTNTEDIWLIAYGYVQMYLSKYHRNFDTYLRLDLWYFMNLIVLELQHLMIPNDLSRIERLNDTYTLRMRNPLTLITALSEIVYNSRDEEDCTRAKLKLSELISIQFQLSIRHQFAERIPKKRNARMKLAVGMIVTLKDIDENNNIKTGVIIGWTEENYIINSALEFHVAPSGPLYFVLNEVSEDFEVYEGWRKDDTCGVFENELLVSDMPRPIKHPKIGRFFCEYKGTHYMPNEELAQEYPEDVSYLCNEL